MTARFPAITCLVALLATTSPPAARRQSPLERLPQLFVWAWERPEDLRELRPGIGVAFLAQTISIHDGALRTAPRRQPLRLAPAQILIAVTRIETSEPAGGPPLDELAASIAATAALPRVSAIQIDFDATMSERPLYTDLLHRVRSRLPASVPISITALASWCVGDGWLAGLPIDEAVPMLFRMGAANEPFRRIALAPSAAAPACRAAIGTSLDEPIDTRVDGRRRYVFNPRPWTEATLFQLRRGVTE